jgi:UDP-N-acetylmuramate--alanine ligase
MVSATMKHVHLIGIGGSGLSAIALVLLERGLMVSGSDRQASPATQRLQEAGARVDIGHRAANVMGADLVLRSSAVRDDNVEVQAAQAAGIAVFKRMDFLASLMADQRGIAVAGTHGKTTTTAMIAWMLTALGYSPSYIIGGVSINLKNNAHAGKGQYFVIEADEYDRMFLGIHPWLAVVTNIEHDHPDCFPTPEDFYRAFRSFGEQVQEGGALVACGEDPGAARLLTDMRAVGRRALSYGIQQGTGGAGDYDYQARKLAANDRGGFTFEAWRGANRLAQPIPLQVPGLHNVLNALAALSVADLLGVSLDEAAEALAGYRGVGRRFEVRDEVGGVTIIDDYAHHPTEIRATLAAARARYPGRRIWAVWQPHTYSRIRALFDEFANAFTDSDGVLVTEIYAAREAAPADGFSGRQIAEAISAACLTANGSKSQGVYFTPGLEDARNVLLDHTRPGDVVIILSAGDADQLALV